MRGFVPLCLAVVATAIAWRIAFHLPFDDHHATAMNVATLVLQGATALVAVIVFALAVVWTGHLVTRLAAGS